MVVETHGKFKVSEEFDEEVKTMTMYNITVQQQLI